MSGGSDREREFAIRLGSHVGRGSLCRGRGHLCRCRVPVIFRCAVTHMPIEGEVDSGDVDEVNQASQMQRDRVLGGKLVARFRFSIVCKWQEPRGGPEAKAV